MRFLEELRSASIEESATHGPLQTLETTSLHNQRAAGTDSAVPASEKKE